MIRFLLTLLLTVPALVEAQSATSLPEDFVLGASLRTRAEYRYDFKFDDTMPGNNDNFLLNQVRVNLRWAPSERYAIYIEGQDATITSSDSINDEATPNIYSDNLDLHQSYAEANLGSTDVPIRLKVGRQKLVYGNERLVGALEWVNTARVFDAALLRIGDVKTRSLELLSSRAIGVDPDDFNDWGATSNRYADSSFHGAYYADRELITRGALDAYYLLRYEDAANDQVHTTGGRVDIPLGDVLWDSELACQFGDFGGLDHRAFAAHTGVTYTVSKEEALKAGVAYNYGSGDENPDDNQHHTFDNLYPTNHAFYGYMDFFSLQNIHNLELSLATTPIENLTIRAAWQNFWLARPDSDGWYNAGMGTIRPAAGAGAESYVGNEIDLTARYSLIEKKVMLEAGYCHFFAGAYVDDTGSSEDADFTYLQFKIEV